ncbi:hypothetical protein ACFX2A_024250 [Malus domestica]
MIFGSTSPCGTAADPLRNLPPHLLRISPSQLFRVAALHLPFATLPCSSSAILFRIASSDLHLRSRSASPYPAAIEALLRSSLFVHPIRNTGMRAPQLAADLKDILGSVGAEADSDKIELLLFEVKGKDITELIASGREKLASVPSGGGAVAYSAPAAVGGDGAAAPAAAEQKEEEKVEEKEESDDDMGFSLFD